MSDLEATSSRGQSAAPITAIASARLRTISPGGPAFAQSAGLVDAFAEVFARIASSARPAELQDPIANTSDSQLDTNDKTTQSDQDASSESESLATSESGSKVDVEQLTGGSDDQLAVAEDQETETGDQITEAEDHVAVVNDQVSVVVDDDQTDQDDAGTESVVIAAVEVIQADPNEAELKSSDVIVPEVEQEDGRRRRREHDDSAAVDPVDNTEGGRRHGERTSDDEQIHRTGEAIGETDEQSLESTDQTGREDSSRTRGRPRYDNDSVDPTSRSASQANAARAQQGASGAASGEAAADQIGQTADAPSQSTAKSVESAVAHVQSVAARVQQSSTLTPNQAGTRGSTQAIESTTSTRSDASPKADPTDNKGNTAETVSRIKLIQRVSKAFQHLGPEGGTIRLRLAPAEMGSIRVEMRINQRKVQARVVAETEAASAALREHLPDLRARIESFGMQVERLEIETDGRDWHQESQFDAESQQQQQQQRQNNGWSGRPNPGTNQPVLRVVSQATPVYQIDGKSAGVDVRF
jgi:flagellar hook-length control protein FliK